SFSYGASPPLSSCDAVCGPPDPTLDRLNTTRATTTTQPSPAKSVFATQSCCAGSSISTQPYPNRTAVSKIHRGRRSSRTRFTEQQLETLQEVFEATPYPREEEYDKLSALLSLPNRVIVVWFQNARQRARKNQERGTDDGFEGKNHSDWGETQTLQQHH
uniref:Homeobox domain-containing protein n=1 Tax=Anabas testudineus TaxID=64144 RepID=A0A7N6AN15_ANATE